MNFPNLSWMESGLTLLVGLVVGAGSSFLLPSPGASQAPTQSVVLSVPVSPPHLEESIDSLQKKIASYEQDSKHKVGLVAYINGLSVAELKTLLDHGETHEVMRLALKRLFELKPTLAVNYVESAFASQLHFQQVLKDYRAQHSTGYPTKEMFGNSPQSPAISPDDAMQAWIQYNPQEALQWVVTHPNKESQWSLLQTALPFYASINPGGALQFIQTWQGDFYMKKDLVVSTMQMAASNDLAGSLAAVQALPPGQDRSAALAALLAAGAEVDPKSMLALALQFSAGNTDIETGLVESVARTIAEDDPELALSAAKSIADPKKRDALVEGALGTLIRVDPQSAWDFASTQLTGKEQVNAVSTICHDAARNNPDQVAGWIMAMPPGLAKSEACYMLLFQWADQEPERAAAWVVQLPDDQNKVNQISRVVSHWAPNDPASAATWIDSLPAGQAHDVADSTFAWRVYQKDPTQALNRAVSIGDPKTQQRVLTQLYNQVLTSNPGVAQNWIQQANLPDALKQKLLTPSKK